MPMSPFHALYTARELSSYARNADRLVTAYASSDIEIYPYQIAAATFALRSPYASVLSDVSNSALTACRIDMDALSLAHADRRRQPTRILSQ